MMWLTDGVITSEPADFGLVKNVILVFIRKQMPHLSAGESLY
jgi:hypothetical protein